MAVYFQFFEAAPLDFAHSNDGAIHYLAYPFGIRPEHIIDHL
jgi:hypothetical protein